MKRYVAALLAFFVMLMPLSANAVDVCLPGVKVGSVIQLEQQCIVRLGDAPTVPSIPQPTQPPKTSSPSKPSTPKPKPKPVAPKSNSPQQVAPRSAAPTPRLTSPNVTPEPTKKPSKDKVAPRPVDADEKEVTTENIYIRRGQQIGLGILLVASGFGLGYLVFYRKPNHLTPPPE